MGGTPQKEGEVADGAEKLFANEYALVGELILTASGLEHQLTRVLIALLHLSPSPLLFPVVVALDSRRKLDMLKARVAHIPSGNAWKITAQKYVDLVERAQKGRNIACHLMPKIEGTRLTFVPIDAARILKDLNFDPPSVEEVKTERLESDLLLAQRALASGEELLTSIKRVNAELDRRRGK